MPVEWNLYEQDVLRVYVDGGKTIDETRDYLLKNRNLDVSQKQFKQRFGGLKNLRSDEWRVVTRVIKKRRAQRRESEVYLLGRRLDPKRVAREIQRYCKHGASGSHRAEEDSHIDLGIDTIRQHRIEIRTPISNKIISPLDDHVSGPQLLMEHNEVRQLPDAESGNEVSDYQPTNVTIDSLDAMDMDFSLPLEEPQLDDDFDLYGSENAFDTPPVTTYTSAMVPLTKGFNATNWILDPQSTHTQFLPAWVLSFSNLPLSVPGGSSGLTPPIVYNSVGGFSGMSMDTLSTLPDIFSYILDNSSNANSLQSPYGATRDQLYPKVQWGKKGCLLAHLLNINPKLRALESIAQSVEQSLILPNSSRLNSANLQNSSLSRQPVIQVFAVIAYLTSNNLLGISQIQTILCYIVDEGLVDQLLIFLQRKSANVTAFAEYSLRAMCSPFPLTPRVSEKSNYKFQPLLDRYLSARAFSKDMLGELLCNIASTSEVEIAKMLISHGANINVVARPVSSRRSLGMATPLCQAVFARSTRMVRYLIAAGADVNKRIKNELGEGEENALTLAIRSEYQSILEIVLDGCSEIDTDIRIDGSSIFEFAKRISQSFKTYETFRARLAFDQLPQTIQLVEAAEKGNRILSQLLLEHNITQKEVLEGALCQAVKLGNIGAVRTFLKRGIDPDALTYRLHSDVVRQPVKFEDTRPIILAATYPDEVISADLVYIFKKAGATIDEEFLREICRTILNGAGTNVLKALAVAGCPMSIIGPTLLEVECQDRSIHYCDFYLDKGSPINAYGIGGLSVLQAVAKLGYIAFAQFLIDRGAEVDLPASEYHGQTALQAAASAGHIDMVDFLISLEANVRADPAKVNGVSVLEAAATVIGKYDAEFDYSNNAWKSDSWENGGKFSFKTLLALGAHVNRIEGTGGTVLHELIKRPCIESLKLVLQAGARIEDRDSPDGMKTPLQVAVSKKNMEAIQILLDHGANVNAAAGDNFGRTALQAATSEEDPDHDIIELLLSYGAEISAPPALKGGLTALQGAAIRGDFRTVKMFIQRGADVNEASSLEEGRTAIEGAAEHGRLDMVRFLLSMGAKGNLLTGLAKAIELAKENKRYTIANVLLEQESINRNLLRHTGDSLFTHLE